MRRLLGLLLAYALIGSMLVACSGSQKASAPQKAEEEVKTEIEVENSILEEDDLSKQIKYVDEHIKNFSPEEVDENLDKIAELQIKYIGKYRQIVSENFSEEKLNLILGHDKIEIDKLETEKERKLITEIFNRGYKLECGEGEVWLGVDDGYLRKYSTFLSEERKDYQEILAKASDVPAVMDACIMISWDELANRALKAEGFLTKYKNSSKRDEIAGYYESYIWLYTSGCDNSPIANRSTKKIDEEVLNSYRKTVAENEGTATAKIIKTYLEAIEGNNLKITDSVTEVLDRSLETTRSELGIEYSYGD